MGNTSAKGVLALSPRHLGPTSDAEMCMYLMCVRNEGPMRSGAFEVHSVRTGSDLLCGDSWPLIHSLN
jgi:hypothetical protein